MKKCPTCQRTFDDSLRFCQSDGTPLIDDAPVDPYKTMVASSEEIAAAMGSASGTPSDSEGSARVDDEVLQLPQDDPKKTMYASEEEIRKEMQAHDEPVIDLPPLASEPPKPAEPRYDPPSYGSPPPPSPFSPSANEPIANPMGDSPFSRTTPPIPSPFDNPKPSTYDSPTEYKPAPEPEPFRPAEPASFEPLGGPIEPIAPPAAPGWQAVEPMQNIPISPAAAGQNKTLAIVSLVAGILGLPCCGLLVISLAAIILGVVARGKASKDPANYGGSGLATAGIITGILGLVGGIAYLVWLLLLGGMQVLMQAQGVQ